MSTRDEPESFDAIVIGTGFAGAVTACRLVEAKLRICVLERGRRYAATDFPTYPTEDLFASGQTDEQGNFAPPPDFSRWLWSRDNGIYDVRELDDVVAVQAAGYGGGSLIYANVHLRPPREVFDDRWPEAYRAVEGPWKLEPYFDLAAYMLRATPIPQKLSKTLQLQAAARTLYGGVDTHWFRTPLAVNFDEFDHDVNGFGRKQRPCDMRGRCWLGCDNASKNTLDLNYLARAETGPVKPDVRTLAEVTAIERNGDVFTVTYRDLVFRNTAADSERGRERRVRGKNVFLCAGAINTTELLFRNWRNLHLDSSPEPCPALGSHYFPNSDSVGAVFECSDTHEPHYGPTITSALLVEHRDNGSATRSLDFRGGYLMPEASTPPAAGMKVTGRTSGVTARLTHNPLLDWGTWQAHDPATGALVLEALDDDLDDFEVGEELDIGGVAVATMRSRVVSPHTWFLAEDGGYPPDLEPLIGVFRSPLWARRNRYIEHAVDGRVTPTRRRGAPLRLQSFAQSLGGTARETGSAGALTRAFDSAQLRTTDLFEEQVSAFFPQWFVDALNRDRKALLGHAAALALPMLGRLLDELSKTAAAQIDSEMLNQLVDGAPELDDRRQEMLIRGLLRQGLQILAGTEVEVAVKVANVLLKDVPETPGGLLDLLGRALLWAIAYGEAEGHTAILLTMGRDPYRGRLECTGGDCRTGRLTARLPNRLVDTSSAVQERVLRTIASEAWKGELRTNPTWATFGRRLTVHSQGGCPMGDNAADSVTKANGEVHGCKGIYVMDAAAFPVSVGVNPSATIAAIAEFKVEQFIRGYHASDPEWASDDHAAAREWIDENGRRRELDPLNSRVFPPSEELAERIASNTLRLSFRETMTGFFAERSRTPIDFDNLAAFPDPGVFLQAEDEGSRGPFEITAELEANVTDLARLISKESGVVPLNNQMGGQISLGGLDGVSESCRVAAESFLQLFVRPPAKEPRPVRFFRYRLWFDHGPHRYRLDGVKVLRDAPGFDVWSDTSTLYAQLTRVRSDKVWLGVMRISIDGFREQLKTMEVDGTTDDARRSWALAAFYKYFARELSDVYVDRAEALKNVVRNLLTEIHV